VVAKQNRSVDSEGIICIHFPPHVPYSVAIDLHRRIRETLSKRDECMAANMGAFGISPGCVVETRIKKLGAMSRNLDAILAMLGDADVAIGTTVTTSERRGPVSLEISNTDNIPLQLASLAPPNETPAQVELFLCLPCQPNGIEGLASQIELATNGYGIVDDSIQLSSRASIDLVARDISDAINCVNALLRILATLPPQQWLTITAYSQTNPVFVEPNAKTA
jgi:hypothetical protein